MRQSGKGNRAGTGKTRKPKTLKELRADPQNARRHTERNLAMIGASLDAVGAARSIVIDETARVLAGNATVDQARRRKLKLKVVDVDGKTVVAVRRSGLTDAEKTALALYDNRAAELAAWDPAVLAAIGAGGLDLGSFWDADELAQLLAALETPAAGKTDPDAVPALRRTSIRPGDVFTLGAHRLICGDSTAAATFATLLGEERLDLVVTSPPYNVGIAYAQHRDTQERDAYLTLISGVAANVVAFLKPGRFVGWNIGVSPKTFGAHQVIRLEQAGLMFYREIVWRKSGVSYPLFPATMRHRRARHYLPNYQHELILVLEKAGKDDASCPCPLCDGAGEIHARDLPLLEGHETLQLFTHGKPESGGPNAPDPRYQNDVWEIHQSQATVGLQTLGAKSTGLTRRGRPSHALKAHPAAFPVEVPRAVITFLTNRDELVGEPFGGAGSSLIACEQLGRRARVAELDPQYCQLIVDRWEAFTGQKAVKAGQRPHEPRGVHRRRKGQAA